MTWAEKLKIECTKRGTSANALCLELGFSHSAFTYWGRKKTAPREEDIARFAALLEMTPEELMEGVDGIPARDSLTTIIATPDENEALIEPMLTEQEREIIMIYRAMPLRKQYEFLKAMYEISHDGGMV